MGGRFPWESMKNELGTPCGEMRGNGKRVLYPFIRRSLIRICTLSSAPRTPLVFGR